jgi:polysaccharide export outer membrane protein
MAQCLDRSRTLRLGGGLVLGLLLSATAALADLTRVAPGDVLRVEVIDAPEFSREAPVDADGRIALPVLGRLAVAGLDLDAARLAIGDALRDQGLLNAPQVLVEIAQYRPVYVGGSVRNPGAVDFAPGLTARQAVIAAGGVDLDPDSDKAGPEAALAAMAMRRATAFRLAQVAARIQRLSAEIEGIEQMENAGDAPDEAAVLAERRARVTERGRHTEAMLGLIANEIDTLDRQAALQDEEVSLQQSEIDNARTLVDRGLMQRTQFQDLLREKSQLNRDQLENRAFAARAAQQASTVKYELSHALSVERETLRAELADAQSLRAGLMAELESLDLQILVTGLATLDPTAAAPRTRLTIHRNSRGKPVQIEGAFEEMVQPGDVLDLVLLPPAPAEMVGQ